MDLSLRPASVLALTVSMTVLAALPSTSVLAVTAQSAAFGFRHGAAVSAGVVVGDLVYILLAIFGLSLLVDAMDGAMDGVRYIGGLYLLWLGVRLWRSATRQSDPGQKDGGGAPSMGSSFATGLLITLGDQKAVLFYLGFLPAFMNLGLVTTMDVAVIALVAALSVGGVKLLYAAAASRARILIGPGVALWMNRAAAGVMIGVGLFLLTKNVLLSS